MLGNAQIVQVKGGQIRSDCPKCKTTRYVSVSPSQERVTVRCKCGKTSNYIINHRASARERITGAGEILLDNIRKFPIHLTDTSATGIGFKAKYFVELLQPNQDVVLSYRSPYGSKFERKVRIKRIQGDKVGAIYSDNMAQQMAQNM